MRLPYPDELDIFAKALFIGGACVWAIGVLWTTRGEWHKIRFSALKGPHIGVMVCMALFFAVFIGAHFWGGGQVSMMAMFFLVTIMAAFVYWGRSAEN
jgi:hypothetical protein